MERWVIARAFRAYSAADKLQSIMEKDHGAIPQVRVTALKWDLGDGPVVARAKKPERSAKCEAQELFAQIHAKAKAKVVAALANARREEADRARARKATRAEKRRTEEKAKRCSGIPMPSCEVILSKHFLERLSSRRGDFKTSKFLSILSPLVEAVSGVAPRAAKVRMSNNCYVVAKKHGSRVTLITIMPVKGQTEQERSLWHVVNNPDTEMLDLRPEVS